MATTNGIQAFIIRGAFTPINAATEPDPNQFVNKSTTIDPKSIFTYDFIDGGNDDILTDTDTNDATRFGSNDFIRYDGVQKKVTSLFAGTIRITYDDGSFYDSPATGVRFFALENGDLIINPLDSTRTPSPTNPIKPVARWSSATITGINTTGSKLQRTSMSPQDDPFPVCFAGGTLIETSRGMVPVEALRKDDLVQTQDNGMQPIRWIGSQSFSAAALTETPKLRPIRICAGALGKQIPSTDLVVSPQHRILIRSKIVQRMFGASEILVAAKSLVEIEGIEIADDIAEVDYFHILFDRHEIIFSNGAATESFHTGAQALRSIGDAAREEIFAVFPELRDSEPTISRMSARPLMSGRRVRHMATRHTQNQSKLIQ